jgi:hypothetical protein
LVQMFSLGPCSQAPSVYAIPLLWETKFTPIQNNWQNDGFVCFNLYILWQQEGRQKTLGWNVASITTSNPFVISKHSLLCFGGELASNILKKILRNVLTFESILWLLNTESQFSLLRCVINSLIVSLFMSMVFL